MTILVWFEDTILVLCCITSGSNTVCRFFFGFFDLFGNFMDRWWVLSYKGLSCCGSLCNWELRHRDTHDLSGLLPNDFQVDFEWLVVSIFHSLFCLISIFI